MESSEDALLRVKRLVNVRQRYRSLLDEHRYSGLSVQTAMYLIGQPTVTASMLRRRFGKSPSAVQHALSRLVSVGILRAYPAGRGNLYIAPDIHKVLAAPLGAAIDVSAPLMSSVANRHKKTWRWHDAGAPSRIVYTVKKLPGK